jgi:molybdopterin synthase catalytic subunit
LELLALQELVQLLYGVSRSGVLVTAVGYVDRNDYQRPVPFLHLELYPHNARANMAMVVDRLAYTLRQ